MAAVDDHRRTARGDTMSRPVRYRALRAVRRSIRMFERSGRPACLLDEVPLRAAQALCAAVSDQPSSADQAALAAAGQLFYLRFEVLGAELGGADLAAAVDVFTTLGDHDMEAVPIGLRPVVWALGRHFPIDSIDERSQAGDIAVAFCKLGESVRSAPVISIGIVVLDVLLGGPVDPASRAMYLINLGRALRSRFEAGGSAADLERAVEGLREAVAVLSADDLRRGPALANLGIVLRSRYERHGWTADLDAAVDALRAAAEAIADGRRTRPGVLTSLGNALRARFESLGSAADLDEAVVHLRLAVALIDDQEEASGLYMSNLSNALRVRFGRDRAMADLSESIAFGRRAVSRTPDTHPYATRCLTNLGTALETRAEETADTDVLDQAIDLFTRVVDMTPDTDPYRGQYLSNLGNALRVRYARHGALADIDATVAACRVAIRMAPQDHFDRSGFLSNLGGALLARFDGFGDTADLAAAIAALDEAAHAVPLDLPGGATFRVNLANALRVSYDHIGDPAIARRALSLLQEVTGAVTAPIVRRVSAARWWGEITAALGDLDSALLGYTAAVDLVPVVAWQGLSQQDRMRALEALTGLGADAAGAALEADQPDRAVHLVERARGVLHSQVLQARTQVAQLEALAPDLALRMRAIRRQLDAPGQVPGRGVSEIFRFDLS